MLNKHTRNSSINTPQNVDLISPPHKPLIKSCPSLVTKRNARHTKYKKATKLRTHVVNYKTWTFVVRSGRKMEKKMADDFFRKQISLNLHD